MIYWDRSTGALQVNIVAIIMPNRNTGTTAGLKRLRTTQASALTRAVNKGLTGLNQSRSKSYLRECIDDIVLASTTLAQTNDLYVDELSDRGDIAKARGWLAERREIANRAVVELNKRLFDSTLPSITIASEVGATQSRNGRSTFRSSNLSRMILEAQQAQLEVKQAVRRAELMEEETYVKSKHEMARVKLDGKELIERATLKAEVLMDAADQMDIDRDQDIVNIVTAPETKQEFVEAWVTDNLVEQRIPEMPVVMNTQSPHDRITGLQTAFPLDNLQVNPTHVDSESVRSHATRWRNAYPRNVDISRTIPAHRDAKAVGVRVEMGHAAPPSGRHLNVDPSQDVVDTKSELSRDVLRHAAPSVGKPKQEIYVDNRALNPRVEFENMVPSQCSSSTTQLKLVTPPLQECAHQRVSESELNPLTPKWTFSAHMHEDSIDAWIDKLIPGTESVVGKPILNSDRDELTETLVRLEHERDLPQVQIPIFDGTPLMWPKFVERFHAQVHCRWGINDTRRIDLLQSHLKGEAKILVEGIGYSGRCYAEALQELKRHFGHRNKVARAYLDQVLVGSNVPSRNPAALRKFYIDLRDCIITLTQLHYTSDIVGTDVLLRAAKRIPQ
jgi:hypothetical protein